MSLIETYYNDYNEDGRLLTSHGRIEFLTTMKYIQESLSEFTNPKILEVGAGTGRYSVTLAKKGYDVTSVDLVEHNLNILKSKLDGTEKIQTFLGNALDLSMLDDNSFDVTMLLGPLYHLYTKQDKIQALQEAVRVTKPGGRILVAYCMNESTIIQYVFLKGNLNKETCPTLTEDWQCISAPKDVFEMVRIEDIEELNSYLPVKRIKLVATDGASRYIKDFLEEVDEKIFDQWVSYHLATCERQDLIGASNHTLDILQKI